MLAPMEALAHIKCSACSKYLTYFPVYMNQNSLQPICGRCSELLTATDVYIQDKTYEAFAQFLKFPCIYDSEGCVEYLPPTDIPQHEKICPYRIISCLLDCIWQGTVAELINHIEEVHPGVLIRNGEFEMDILNSYETHSFVVSNNEIFALRRKFNKENKTLQCSVSCYKMKECDTKYYYELTMFNGSRNLSVKFPMKSADDVQEENIIAINVEEVRKRLGDPSIIIGYIKIFTLEAPDEEKASKQPKTPNSEINMDMLGELECPVCFEYIIPPIYQCIAGHSICGECKSKVRQCPTCKGEIRNTQNFTLEKMAFLLTYPCKFKEFGCDFASKPGQMKQHQKHCLLGPQLCPLREYEDCEWEGIAKDVYSHVTMHHHDNLLEIDNVHTFLEPTYFQNEDSECYIKKFSNVMFKVHFKYAQGCFYWAVQFIGPQAEAGNYKFEIDFHDSSNNNQKVFIRSLCTPLKEKLETFNEPGQYVFLKREQINCFITDQCSYTLRITK